MSLIRVLTEPAILFIITAFILAVLFVTRNYARVQKNLKEVYIYLAGINKSQLSYRFEEMDSFMSTNAYTSTIWEDFKKVLMRPDQIYLSEQNYKSPEMFLTVDSSYFFNEETLVLTKINYKFIQTIPTILTGLGPFFTFLKMAIAFSVVDLSYSAETTDSLNSLMSNIQIAALCSVFAVGFSLLFMLLEKNLYNRMCKKYYLAIQKEFIRIFDVKTSEKFLVDLVYESKSQSIKSEQLLQKLPENMEKSLSDSFNKTVVPYMENILYALNKLNEKFGKNNDGDIVDKLF